MTMRREPRAPSPEPRAEMGRTGTAMIEAAVVLPVLILLLFGIMEAGRALMTYNLLTRSVRAGVRLAVITPDLQQDDPRVLSRINDLLDDGGATAASSEMTFVGGPPTPGDPQRGLMVRVGAEVEFVPAVSMVFDRTIPLRAQVVARHE